MKHLIIKNFGPLHRVDVTLESVNLIIGLHSSGKTCVLRAACFCSWVEKRIMLMQSAEYFKRGSTFIDSFLHYYKMESYLKDDTYIEYSSPYLKLIFDNSKGVEKFYYEAKKNKWRYHRPKIAYIPSDRNVVSLFKNYKQLPNAGVYLQDFMSEWDKVRRRRVVLSDILQSGLKYSFDVNTEEDIVTLQNGQSLSLSETSSGVQSMLPLFVYTDYLTKHIFEEKWMNLSDISLDKVEEIKHTFELIYDRCLETRTGNRHNEASFLLKQQKYLFSEQKECDKFNGYVNRLLQSHHSELFLEEIENNLFPPTQCQYIRWLLDRIISEGRNNSVFLTTHSPYVLSALLQEDIKGFKLMLTYPSEKEGLYSVKTASDEDLQQIYDNGSDAFFNFEAFTN